MRSDMSARSLPPGIWKILSNFRCSTGGLKVRWGCNQINDTPPASGGLFRGCWGGVLDQYLGGTETIVIALRVGAGTRLYYSTNTGSTWAELTTVATRFATDGLISFAPIKTREGLGSSQEGLLAQNGTDRPFVWFPYYSAAKVPALTNPGTGNFKAYPAQALSLTGAVGTWTTSVSAVIANFTITRAATGQAITLKYPLGGTTTAENYTAYTTTFTEKLGVAAASFALTKQFAFAVMEHTTDKLMLRIKEIKLRKGGGTYDTIWKNDGSVNGSNLVETPLTFDGTTYKSASLYTVDCPTFDGTVYTGFQFVVDGLATPSAANIGLDVVWAGTGGDLAQPIQWAVSLQDQDTKAETNAIVLEKRDGVSYFDVAGASISSFGGTLPLMRWPNNSLNVATSYVLTYTNSALVTTDTDPIAYGTPPGGSAFGQFSIAGGTFTTPNYVWYFTSGDADFATEPYDSETFGMPVGSCISSIDGRLYVGRGSEIWISAEDDPYRYRKSVIVDDQGIVDEKSPCFRALAGESVMAFCKQEGTIYESNAVGIFTKGNAYRQNGGGASSISQGLTIVGHRGTQHPYTVAPIDGQVFFLDSENEVRVSNGSSISKSLSRTRIGDRIRTRPMFSGTISVPCSAAAFDLFAMAYPGVNPETGASDTLNQEMAILDSQTGEWVIDRFTFDIAGMVISESSGKRRLIAISNTGSVWDMYVEGEDTDGGPIRAYAESGLLCEGWQTMNVYRIGVVAEDTNYGANPAITTGRLPWKDSEVTGTIDMSTGDGWRVDVDSNGGIPGAKGQAVGCRLFGNMSGGGTIHGVIAEVEVTATDSDSA